MRNHQSSRIEDSSPPTAPGGGAVPSLEQLRNKERFLQQTNYQRWMHKASDLDRMAVLNALYRHRNPVNEKRQKKMEACGGFAQMVEFSDGAARVCASPCKQRCCPTCSRRHGRTVTDKVAAAIKKIDVIRFLTLTIKAEKTPLASQIDHLIRSFRRLRQSRMWKDTQRGAIGVMEVTLNL